MSLGLGEITTQAHGLIGVGDLPAARNLLAAALADTDPRPANASAEHADAAGLLARVLVALGDAPAARGWAAYAYSANQRMHGLTDERTIGAAATLAAVLHRVGSHARAAHLYREVIDELCAIDGPESLRVLAAHADLATVEFARGQCDIARDRLEDAWELHREVYGDGHPAGIRMLARLGAMQRDCGRLTESDMSLSLAVDLCRAHLPADHPLTDQVRTLAGSPADAAHRCGGDGRADGDVPGRPDDAPGPDDVPGPDGGDSAGPASGAFVGPGGPPAPRAPTDPSPDHPIGAPATANGHPATGDQIAANGHAAASGHAAAGERAAASGHEPPWAYADPPWAQAGWIEPEPASAELADPTLAPTLWADRPEPQVTQDRVHSDPPGHGGARHRVDPPWIDMPAPPPPLPEFDTEAPWAHRGWIEREPVRTDADDPVWSPTGWLAEEAGSDVAAPASPATGSTADRPDDQSAGSRVASGPADPPRGPEPEAADRPGAEPTHEFGAEATENGRATIPPPRVPVDVPPAGLRPDPGAPTDPDADGGRWLFDEPWWPPELAGDDEPPPVPPAGDSGPVSPFGPVRYRATGGTPAEPPAGDGSATGERGGASPEPFPPDVPAFVPNPRAPHSAGHWSASTTTEAPAGPYGDEVATGPGHNGHGVDDVDPASGRLPDDGPLVVGSAAAESGTGSRTASSGTLSRLPRREISRLPDRRSRLPVRRERGHLVPVPRPAASTPRPRAPMLVLTGVVVVLLGAAAVVAGVSLVGDTGSPTTAPSAAGTPPAPTSEPPPPPAPGTPPSEVGMRDNRDSVTLSWTYPAGAEGQVLISGGSSDQEPRAFMTLPAGSNSFVAYGLDQSIDYCFTVAVVYSADVIGQAAPVCTDRGQAR